MRIVIYTLLVIAALLPLLFRRRYWVRVTLVLLLTIMASLHCFFLISAHRLVLERGLQEDGGAIGGQPLVDLPKAVEIVQDLNHDQLTFVALLFTAFAVLALVPFQRVETKKDDL